MPETTNTLSDALVGRLLGPYRIQAVLGRGGMSVVYRATQTTLNRLVALKVLPQEFAGDTVLVQRFLQEARAAADLQQPNIIPVYDLGKSDDVYFIAMRLIEGVTLARAVPAGGLPLVRVVGIVEQIAAALDYAHARGVIHRDVSAGNVMLETGDRVTLMDFGIAQAQAGGRLTRAGVAVGTLEYLSPEQARGEAVTPQSDVYSLGVLTYELLTGTLPFRAPDDRRLILQHLGATPPSIRTVRPDVPVRVDDAIARCLAKDPLQRFPNAGAFGAQLRAALGDTRLGAAFLPAPKLTRPAPLVPRRLALAAPAILVALLLAAGIHNVHPHIAGAESVAVSTATLVPQATMQHVTTATSATTTAPALKASVVSSSVTPATQASITSTTTAPAAAASATPAPPTLVNVVATTPSMAVQGFYNALNAALTGNSAAFVRAYSYLSDGLRAKTPFSAFVARYQADTATITFWFPAPSVAAGTATVVVTTTEIQGGQRLVNRLSWQLIATPAGWRLNDATTATANAGPSDGNALGRQRHKGD